MGDTPASKARASTNGLNAEPAWRPDPPPSRPRARLTFDSSQLVPPTRVRTKPVCGSIATSAASGSFGPGSVFVRSFSACSWRWGSRLVSIRRPPRKTRSGEYFFTSSR